MSMDISTPEKFLDELRKFAVAAERTYDRNVTAAADKIGTPEYASHYSDENRLARRGEMWWLTARFDVESLVDRLQRHLEFCRSTTEEWDRRVAQEEVEKAEAELLRKKAAVYRVSPSALEII